MKKYISYKLLLLLAGLSVLNTHAQVNVNLKNNAVLIIQNGCSVNILGNIDVDNTSRIRNEGGTLSISGSSVLNGTVEYGGTGNQPILNGTHGTLIISGGGNKSLTGSIDVTNNLSLGGTAKLLTGSNILTLKGGSSSITGGVFGTVASSWIVTGNGGAGAGNSGLGGIRIENIGTGGRTTAVLFPTGPTPAVYNPLRLTNTGTLDNFMVTVSDQAPTGCISGQCITRSWNISESVAGGSTANIDLQFNTGEAGGGVDLHQVSVAHYAAGGIDKKGNSQNVSAQTSPYTVSGSGFDTFSPYGISSNQFVLPVGLVYFSGRVMTGNKIALQWNVEEQAGIREYIVERSADGIRFTESGRITANNFNKYTYDFIDIQPISGNNYYRLKLLEYTKASYSSVIRMNLKNTAAVFIYPSPAHGSVILQANEPSLVNSIIKLTDIQGKVLAQIRLTALPMTMNIEKLVPGLYIMQLADGRSYKIVKE